MSLRPARGALVVAALLLLGAGIWLSTALTRESRLDAVAGVPPPSTFVRDVVPQGTACQPVSPVVQRVDRAVLTLGTYARASASVELVARAGGTTVASSGVVTISGGVVTLPLRPAVRPSQGALEICLRNRSRGRLAVAGVFYPPAPGTTEPGSALSIRLVGPSESGLDRAGLLLDRFSSARAGEFGGWVLILALLGFGACGVAAIAGVICALPGRGPGRCVVDTELAGSAKESGPAAAPPVAKSAPAVPRLLTRGALACAGIGLIVTLCWSVVTPPYQVPDEPLHYAYAEHFALTGTAPAPGPRRPLSTELEATMSASRFSQTIGNAESGRPPWPDASEATLRATLDADLPSGDGGGPSGASTQPPAYYALGAVGYRAADLMGADAVGKLQAVRLVSVLLAALTTLFVFDFVRCLLPDTALAAPAGALVVAFQPMFGFVGSGVNADALLFTVAAALFAALARSFRFGPTTRRIAAIGALVGLGMITKLTFLGLVPGALFGSLVISMRLPRATMRRAVLAGASAALAPLIAYFAVSRVAWDRPLLAAGPPTGNLTGRQATPMGTLSYLLQFYLPRLPFLKDSIPGGFPVYSVWFTKFVGHFGWLDYAFPRSVVSVALGAWLVLTAFAGRALVSGRTVLRSRRAEIATYLLMVGGLLLVIGVPAYAYLVSTTYVFEQIRYLFPLLALYGGFVGLAIRGAGPRWGPAVAASAVSLAVAHSSAALLLTLSRYYL